MRHLQLHLRELDALCAAKDVRISHRLHRNHVVKVSTLDLAARARHIVRIFIRHVLAKALKEQSELQRLRVVQSLVDRGHDHRATLKQRQRRTDLCVLIAVADLHIGSAREPLTRVNQESKQCKQHLTRFFVRKRHQRRRKLCATGVNIPPLARLDWIRVIRNARALGFEARRQICQRSGVN